MMTVHWPCKLGYLDASCALAIVTRGKIINGMKANDDWQRMHSLLMWWSLFQLSPTRRRLRVATPPRRRRATLSNRGVSLPDASRAPDRKDSTPRHGRLLHPSSRAERDDRDHAADNFFQGRSPKTGHPISPPGPPHRQKSFLTKFPGMAPGWTFHFVNRKFIQAPSPEIWSETISGGEEVLAGKWGGLFLGYLLGRNYRRRDRDHLVPPRRTDAAVCRAEVCYPFCRKHGSH